MRLLASFPFLATFVSLILLFLCLFAGNKPGVLDDFYLISLNTSEVGASLGTHPDPSNPLTAIIGQVATALEEGVAKDIAQAIGIKDFYSLHTLDYCSGWYTPNATAHHVKENVTYCSPHDHRYTPGQALQNDIDQAGTGYTITQLGWPHEVDVKFAELYDVLLGLIGVYALAIFVGFLALVSSFFWLLKNAGRGWVITTVILTFLAFIFAGIASALATGVAVKGQDILKEYAGDLGVDAKRGNKFLALTWAATALAFLAWVWSLFSVCFSRGSRKTLRYDGPEN